MPVALAFLNGRFVPAPELTVGFADAGLVSGVTVTDFCRTYRHRLFRWPDHLARLRRDCDACRVLLPHPDAELTAAAGRLVAHHAEHLPPTDDLAVVTFATPGPLGYMVGAKENGPPTVGMHAFPLPRHRYRRFFAEGATLAVAGLHPFEGTVVPAAVKHRSRLHWWLADRAVRDPESPCHCPSGVPTLVDEAGGSADTAVASVLVVAGDRVVRPPPGTVLEGVSLGVVGELCGRLGLGFESGWRRITDPGPEVTEVLLAGSGFGVAGVRAVVGPEGRREFAWPGPVLRKLLAAWSEMVGLDVEGQFLGERGASAP